MIAAAHNITELSSATVERVARRMSRHHRRVGNALLICAAIGAGFIMLGAVEEEAVATLVAGSLVLIAPPLYMYKRRQKDRRTADRIADTAANRLDLDWTYRRSVIQAHDRKGPCPTLVMDAVPRQSEIDGGLAAARVHRL